MTYVLVWAGLGLIAFVIVVTVSLIENRSKWTISKIVVLTIFVLPLACIGGPFCCFSALYHLCKKRDK